MSKLKSRKERDKKPWLSNVFRKYGTPIGPLEEPIHLSMDGRRVGTSLNNIIRQRNMKLFTVEDAIRQKKKLENHAMNPLQNGVTQSEATRSEATRNGVTQSEATQSDVQSKATKSKATQSEATRSEANHKPKRPEPKRLSDKKLIKNPKNANRMTKKGGQIVHYKTNRWHHRWKPFTNAPHGLRSELFLCVKICRL